MFQLKFSSKTGIKPESPAEINWSVYIIKISLQFKMNWQFIYVVLGDFNYILGKLEPGVYVQTILIHLCKKTAIKNVTINIFK